MMNKPPTPPNVIMHKPPAPPSRVAHRAPSPTGNVVQRAPSPTPNMSHIPPTPPPSAQRQRQVEDQVHNVPDGPQLIFHPIRPIIFNGEVGARIIVKTKIKNLTHVAVPYKIKVSNGAMFRVTPATGWLDPKESRQVKILFTGGDVPEDEYFITLYDDNDVGHRLELQFVLYVAPLWTEETVKGLTEAMKLYRFPNATYTVVRKRKKVAYEGRWSAIAAHLSERYHREYTPEQVQIFVESTSEQDMTDIWKSRAESNDSDDDM